MTPDDNKIGWMQKGLKLEKVRFGETGQDRKFRADAEYPRKCSGGGKGKPAKKKKAPPQNHHTNPPIVTMEKVD